MEPGQSSETAARRAARSNGQGQMSAADELRATCERQALDLDQLHATVSALRSGAASLRAANADLRRAAAGRRGGAFADRRSDGLRISVALDQRAPALARGALAAHIGHRVAPGVVADAQLIVSELVTNSVRHSGATPGQTAAVHVDVDAANVRIEVADPGNAGTVPPRADGEHGRGLGVVQTISRRWGHEHLAGMETRVWAELACVPPGGD